MADSAKSALAGVIGGGKGPAAKKASGTKAAAKKAPAKKAAAKKEGTGVVRAKSTVSKEGTQKDAFTGEVLPVTAFPTTKDKDGNIVRGPVARKNLEDWRASKKKDREAAAKAKAAAKAEAKKAPAAS